jgi:quercetin dioxygenase-like cupin family protein
VPVHVTRWPSPQPPDPQTLLADLHKTDQTYTTWGNGPGDEYAVHTHSFHKHLVCLSGAITFTLPASGDAIALAPGDALDLPSGTAHGALVGPAGVRCAEAHLIDE